MILPKRRARCAWMSPRSAECLVTTRSCDLRRMHVKRQAVVADGDSRNPIAHLEHAVSDSYADLLCRHFIALARLRCDLIRHLHVEIWASVI